MEAALKMISNSQDIDIDWSQEKNEYLTPLMVEGDKPYYADGCPYLLLSQASVNKLNTVLKVSLFDNDIE